MLEAFKDIVPDVSTIGTHSLRSGGATAAANAGVPDGLFKRHGRWASESAKDGYVQDSLSSRLTVGFKGFRYLVFSFAPLLIDSNFCLVDLARGTVFYGEQLARGFPPRGKWTYGEVFHPAVVPRPHFNLFSLRSSFFGAVCYLDCILRFYDMPCIF